MKNSAEQQRFLTQFRFPINACEKLSFNQLVSATEWLLLVCSGGKSPLDREARLDHLLEKSVDELLAVTEVAALREVVRLLAPPAARVVKLKEKSSVSIIVLAFIRMINLLSDCIPKGSGRRSHLKVPQEIVGDFEVRSDGEDFVDQVFDADDAELAQPLLDDVVVEGASSAFGKEEKRIISTAH